MAAGKSVSPKSIDGTFCSAKPVDGKTSKAFLDMSLLPWNLTDTVQEFNIAGLYDGLLSHQSD